MTLPSDTTVRTKPAVILAKLRKVNQQIVRLTLDDAHRTVDRREIRRLQTESDDLNREFRDACLWQYRKALHQ